MAQLSNDCFVNDSSLLRLDDARAEIVARVGTVAGIETVGLADCHGRVLATRIEASVSVPPAANSAVDGYALRHRDLDAKDETRLAVIGRAAAGHPFSGSIAEGQAVRIFTGALLPQGADTVMMQEDCIADGDHVRIAPGIKPGSNMRPVGEDFSAGDSLLPEGRRLRPQDVALLAAAGVTEIDVRLPLRLALLSTGDEVQAPGSTLAAGQIYDANRFMLAALARHFGIVVTDLGIVPDRREQIEAVLHQAARTHDAVMSSGGVSTGEEDHVRQAVTAHGSLYLWRLAIKPGRPVALGQIGDTPFIGLPGNPVAAMVTFLELARPLLQRLGGAETIEPLWMPIKAGFSYRKKAGRREYLRVRLGIGTDGLPEAHKFPREGAGIISSLTESDGLMRIDEETKSIEPGTVLPYRSYAEYLG